VTRVFGCVQAAAIRHDVPLRMVDTLARLEAAKLLSSQGHVRHPSGFDCFVSV
jgi:hypothetical protein